MTDTDYSRWKLEHATLFRWGDADLAMVDMWRGSIEANDCTPEELSEASMNLARTSPKTWRAEHLQYILDRIIWRRSTRIIEIEAERDRQAGAFECRACDGSGIIIVPHPSSVRNNEWLRPWYECGVACTCRRGEYLVQRYKALKDIATEMSKKDRNVLIPTLLTSIMQYELANPDWQRQVKLKLAKQQADREAMAATMAEDKRRGPLAKVVRQLVEGQP